MRKKKILFDENETEGIFNFVSAFVWDISKDKVFTKEMFDKAFIELYLNKI